VRLLKCLCCSGSPSRFCIDALRRIRLDVAMSPVQLEAGSKSSPLNARRKMMQPVKPESGMKEAWEPQDLETLLSKRLANIDSAHDLPQLPGSA